MDINSIEQVSGYIGTNHERFSQARKAINAAINKVVEAKVAIHGVFNGEDPNRETKPSYDALDQAQRSLDILDELICHNFEAMLYNERMQNGHDPFAEYRLVSSK